MGSCSPLAVQNTLANTTASGALKVTFNLGGSLYVCSRLGLHNSHLSILCSNHDSYHQIYIPIIIEKQLQLMVTASEDTDSEVVIAVETKSDVSEKFGTV